MQITDEMVEKAAKAFWEAPPLYGDERPSWESLPELEKRHHIGPIQKDVRESARLALEAALNN